MPRRPAASRKSSRLRWACSARAPTSIRAKTRWSGSTRTTFARSSSTFIRPTAGRSPADSCSRAASIACRCRPPSTATNGEVAVEPLSARDSAEAGAVGSNNPIDTRPPARPRRQQPAVRVRLARRDVQPRSSAAASRPRSRCSQSGRSSDSSWPGPASPRRLRRRSSRRRRSGPASSRTICRSSWSSATTTSSGRSISATATSSA